MSDVGRKGRKGEGEGEREEDLCWLSLAEEASHGELALVILKASEI